MKKKSFLLSILFAAVCAVGGASALYCYGALLPQKIHGIRIWASYYEGWLDAVRASAGGNLRYSFDRYFAEGLEDYARGADGIGSCIPPKNVAWAPFYYEGFNRYMEGKIQKKAGDDFPDGYVRRYLERGWMDLSKDQPTICPIHHRTMEVSTIPFELVFPFTMARPKFDWEVASEAQFPFPDSMMKVDASLMARPRNARVRVCADCTRAEREWWAFRKTPNKDRWSQPPDLR